MKRAGGLLVALVVGAALGAASVALWRPAALAPTPAPRASNQADGAALAREVAALREQLSRETQRRERLEAELAGEDHANPQGGSGTQPPADDAPAAISDAPAEGGSPSDPWIDAELLTRGGFRADDVEQLRAYFEEIQLDQLYLRDKASREGWVGEPRFRRQMAAIANRSAELRAEWGDDAYDWILYASGRPNRVVVQSVMESSQAAEVGIQEGDVFLRYEDERIFGPRALRRATTGGRLGETATIVLERDGQAIRVFPERGPLGVALAMESKQPEAPAY